MLEIREIFDNEITQAAVIRAENWGKKNIGSIELLVI